MLQSVRCHAVITPDGIHKNSVISYRSQTVPVHGRPLTVTVEGIEVTPFTGEIHSTIDYNGIAVIGELSRPDIKLTVDSISTVINQIASELRTESVADGDSYKNKSEYQNYTIHFIPLL